MKILIAEDEDVTRRAWEVLVAGQGHDVEAVADGAAAWSRAQDTAFDVVISDWVMPGLDGLELCRRVKGMDARPYCYVLMVSARDTPPDVVQGLMAGADDFMVKPADQGEIRARLHAAGRVVDLERKLVRRVAELEDALAEVYALRGLVPVCMYCKHVRREDDRWQEVLEYIHAHGDIDFTHSICPTCYEERVKPMLDAAEGGGEDAGGGPTP